MSLNLRFRSKTGVAALAGAALLAASMGWGRAAMAAGQNETPVKGGTLVYLEQQAHTNLYPPAGGFYPNGGILNQITDKLTYQNPKTLEIEPWIAESWTVNADATEYTFKIRPGVTFSDGTPLDAAAVAKNYDTFGRGNKELKLPVSEVINNYDRSEVIDSRTVNSISRSRRRASFRARPSSVQASSRPRPSHYLTRRLGTPRRSSDPDLSWSRAKPSGANSI